MGEFKYETYGMGGVVLEARFYSFEELKQLLKAEDILNKHLKQSMGEVRSNVTNKRKTK